MSLCVWRKKYYPKCLNRQKQPDINMALCAYQEHQQEAHSPSLSIAFCLVSQPQLLFLSFSQCPYLHPYHSSLCPYATDGVLLSMTVNCNQLQLLRFLVPCNKSSKQEQLNQMTKYRNKIRQKGASNFVATVW